ncbi:hypothetical protein FF098_009885 [Parvularcula flava]|uniref:Uncharacterized protein n=1 Tax=Aquisalinus luteolus TaxID=1566827 RepID=A0A8J3ER41_9PROT|nr:hypothetical protein [Aquisalinus luteolus]NHK28213.1 hypothetical protein [Aquisalinus luteolus]GGH97804.1 hypothetical protein GCM10011355_19900 [Aquisalinus luteolus]
MKNTVEAVLIIGSLALLLGVMALFSVPNLHGFIMGSLFGAYVGFAGLPFFDSGKWKPRPIVCGILAGVACAAIAASRTADMQTVILWGLVGAIAGLFAPIWVKYV